MTMDDPNVQTPTDDPNVRTKSRAPGLIGLGVLAVVCLPLWFFFIGPKLKHDHLVEKGVHAHGRLLSVEETGTVVNDSPQLELVIEFRRNDGVLDTSTTKFIPSLRSLSFFQPNVEVTAAYDPEDPDQITVIDLNTGPTSVTTEIPSSSGASVADSLRRVSDSLKAQLEVLKARMGKGK